MTDDDKYVLKHFLTGFGVTAGVLVVFSIICLVAINFSTGGEPLRASFEVVDTYKGCEVVRFAPHQVAEYKYFLYCEKNK